MPPFLSHLHTLSADPGAPISDCFGPADASPSFGARYMLFLAFSCMACVADEPEPILRQEAGEFSYSCVRPEKKARMFSGRQSRQGRNQSPFSVDGGGKGNRSFRSPSTKPSIRMVSEWPGHSGTERGCGLERNPGGRARGHRAKATRAAAGWLARRYRSGGVEAVAWPQRTGEATGEALLAPAVKAAGER